MGCLCSGHSGNRQDHVSISPPRILPKRGNRVVLFTRPRRPSNVSLAVYLAEQCEKEGYFGLDLSFSSAVDMTFIIGPKFCLFTGYGSPSQGMCTVADPTPGLLRSVKQVSILRSHREDSPDIRLFYDNAEFEDVLTRYCAHHKLPLEKAARTYLYSITNGHPGAVISMLFYLDKVFISRSFLLSERKANRL
jgi:hypothetical protein